MLLRSAACSQVYRRTVCLRGLLALDCIRPEIPVGETEAHSSSRSSARVVCRYKLLQAQLCPRDLRRRSVGLLEPSGRIIPQEAPPQPEKLVVWVKVLPLFCKGSSQAGCVYRVGTTLNLLASLRRKGTPLGDVSGVWLKKQLLGF